MNDVTISYPGGGVDVTRRNKRAILYLLSITPGPEIEADNDPDGSIRWVKAPEDNVSHLEAKFENVYNPTGLRIDAGTLEIGRDLFMGAAASFVRTTNPSVIDGHSETMLLHIPFDDTGTAFPHTPITNALSTDIIFGGADNEVSGTVLGQTFESKISRMIKTIFHEVGTVGATDPVQYSIYTGTDNTGFLIFRFLQPTDKVEAETTFQVELSFELGLRENTDYFIEFVSNDSFSLKTDDMGDILTTIVEEELSDLDLITENLMLDEELGIMFDESLNPMYSVRFP